MIDVLVSGLRSDKNNLDTKSGSRSNFTSGFFFYSSLPQQLLLRARAKLLLLQQLLLLYFWLTARAKTTLFTTRTNSPPSSSTPPHPIRIHTCSRHELRSFTDRLTGLDHEELSSLAGSPRMQSHCAGSGKAANKWVSWGLWPYPLPASPLFCFTRRSGISICFRLPPFVPHPYPSWE